VTDPERELDGVTAANEELKAHALATYRYLRLGIVVAVFVLMVGLIEERIDAGCLKPSISAYFYSPVRSLLVGGLMAIGLALIAIRGRTRAEEVLLNLAGMFAPVVALVPTTPSDDCPSSIATTPAPTVPPQEPLPDWVLRMIDNNLLAYLAVAGAVVLALLGWWLFARLRRPALGLDESSSWFLLSLLIYAVVIAIGVVVYVNSDKFKEYAHWVAALAMFACFFVVVIWNALRWRTEAVRYARAYGAIAIAMVVAAVVMGGWKFLADHVDGFPEWDEAIFWLEVAEILLFALFWGIQTWQFRKFETVLVPAPGGGPPEPVAVAAEAP
jgi:uncharacterized membrane protein